MSRNSFDSPTDRRGRRPEVTRRQFLVRAGGLASMGALIVGGLVSLKFLVPDTSDGKAAEFKLDVDPATITVGNPLHIADKRVTVVRDEGGFYAVFLVCTHLECIPNYVSDVVNGTNTSKERAADRGDRKPGERQPNGWVCPCHGARFFIDSTNFYGPAPRPMDWVNIKKAPDGKLVIDPATIVVRRQAGDKVPPTWRLDYATGNVVHLAPTTLKNT